MRNERFSRTTASRPTVWASAGWTTQRLVGGVRISLIAPGSPAERAGLRVGDCVRQFAGRPIHSDDDFFAAVSGAESPAVLTAERSGRRSSR